MPKPPVLAVALTLLGFLISLPVCRAQTGPAGLIFDRPDIPAAYPDCSHYPDIYVDNCNQRMLRDFIKTRLEYPEEARKAKAEGEVVVAVVIDTAGHMGQIRVAKRVHPALDAEAKRIVQIMKDGKFVWKPAKIKGYIVNSEYKITIPFVLNPPKMRPGPLPDSRNN